MIRILCWLLLLLVLCVIVIRGMVRATRAKRLFLEAVQSEDIKKADSCMEIRARGDKYAMELIRDIADRIPVTYRLIPTYRNPYTILNWIYKNKA